MSHAFGALTKTSQSIFCTAQHCWMLAAIITVLTLTGCAPHASNEREALDKSENSGMINSGMIRIQSQAITPTPDECLAALVPTAEKKAGKSPGNCTARLASTECQSAEFGPCHCTGGLTLKPREARDQPAPFLDGTQWAQVGVTFEATCKATARDITSAVPSPLVDVRAVGEGSVTPAGTFRFEGRGVGSDNVADSEHPVVIACQIASVICGILLTPSTAN